MLVKLLAHPNISKNQIIHVFDVQIVNMVIGINYQVEVVFKHVEPIVLLNVNNVLELLILHVPNATILISYKKVQLSVRVDVLLDILKIQQHGLANLQNSVILRVD